MYNILNIEHMPRPADTAIYRAHVVVCNGIIEKNHTKYSNDQLFKITNGLTDLDLINRPIRRRLLIN
jgi:hypothetical protein